MGTPTLHSMPSCARRWGPCPRSPVLSVSSRAAFSDRLRHGPAFPPCRARSTLCTSPGSQSMVEHPPRRRASQTAVCTLHVAVLCSASCNRALGSLSRVVFAVCLLHSAYVNCGLARFASLGTPFVDLAVETRSCRLLPRASWATLSQRICSVLFPRLMHIIP